MALDFDLTVLRRVAYNAQHQAAQPPKPARPVIIPNWDPASVFE